MNGELCTCGHFAEQHVERVHGEFVIPIECSRCACLHWTAPSRPCENCASLAKLAEEWKRLAEAGERSQACQRLEQTFSDACKDRDEWKRLAEWEKEKARLAIEETSRSALERDAIAAMVGEMQEQIVRLAAYAPITVSSTIKPATLPQAAKIAEARKKVCEEAADMPCVTWEGEDAPMMYRGPKEWRIDRTNPEDCGKCAPCMARALLS